MGKIEEIQRTLRQVVQFQNDQVINAKETEDFVSLDPLDGDAKVRATLNGESYFINVKDINNQRSRSNTPTQLISINIDNNDPEYINKKIADAVNLYPKTKIKDANNVIFYTIRFLGVSDIGYNFVQEYFSLKKEIPLSEDGFAYIGIEATQILEDDIIRISVVDNLNRVNQTFDLGDIGTQTVNEFVNGSGTYTTLTGTINIFKTIENTEEKEYLYTGSQQQIGAGTNAVSLSDFRLLTPETVDPIPPEIPQLTLTDESNNSVTGGLNVNFEGDVIVSQLPDGTLNVAVTSNASDIPPEDQYATVAALIADQNRQEDGNQYFVIDASGFTTVESGNAIVLKNGDFTGTETDYYIIKSKFAIEITDVNGLSAALASKATEAQGVKADTSVQLIGNQTLGTGVKTFGDVTQFNSLTHQRLVASTATGFHFRKYENPVAYSFADVNVDGKLRIEIPVTGNVMWSMKVVILEYDGTTSSNIKTTTLTLTGYSNSNINTSVLCDNPNRITKVELGRNIANDRTVVLVTPSSIFKYPKAQVSELYTSFEYSDLFENPANYAMTVTTDETDYTSQRTILNSKFLRDSYYWNKGEFTSTNVNNWNSAFGWGNHSGLYATIAQGIKADKSVQKTGQTTQTVSGTLIASTLIKSGSDNTQILLGGGLTKPLNELATASQGLLANNSVQLTGDQLIEGLKTFKDPVSFDNGGVRISYGMFQRWLGTTLIGTFAINEQGHFVLRNFIGSGFDALLRTDDLTENRIYDYPNNNGTLGLNINSVLEGEPAGSSIVKNVVSISQADYDAALAAGTLVATTQYLIPEA